MTSTEELRQPPTIDLELLLQPISEDAPSGENVRYSGIYDEISEARRADDTLARGKWQQDLKTADFYRVIELADYTLKSQTKDLQIAAWFSEALVKIHGFAGLRDSLRLLRGLQENFWETLFPEIDEGDQEGRANALAWIEKQAALATKEFPITGGGLSYINWEESRNFDIPENIDTLDYHDQERYQALKAQAEAENRITGDMWRKARAATTRAFCEQAFFALEECWTEYQNLNRVIEEKFDLKQAPGLTNLKQAIDDVKSQVKRLLDEKRIEEPDPEEEFVADTDENGEPDSGENGGVMVGKGALRNRQDALRRLSEVAEYFRKNEPHSPVSYLVARAVKWGNMPLEYWLQDVIKDETTIYNLRQTLGFNTGSGEGGAGDVVDESI